MNFEKKLLALCEEHKVWIKEKKELFSSENGKLKWTEIVLAVKPEQDKKK